jgi:hypothetical protein
MQEMKYEHCSVSMESACLRCDVSVGLAFAVELVLWPRMTCLIPMLHIISN